MTSPQRHLTRTKLFAIHHDFALTLATVVTPTKPRKAKRVNVALKVNLQYPDRETFAERFGQNLSKSGIFIRAKDPVPVGTRITFEYLLADDSRVLRGVGLVRWIRRPEESNEPNDPPGMGIEFVDVDAETDQLITEIVSKYGEGARAPKRERTSSASLPQSMPSSEAVALPTDASFDDEELDVLDALGPGAPKPVPTSTPTPAPTPTPTPTQSSAVAIDFMGTYVHIAPILGQHLGEESTRGSHHVLPSINTEGGDGTTPGVPCVIRWLGASPPATVLRASARRSGVEIALHDDGQIAFVLAGINSTAETLISDLLDTALPDDAETVRVIIPAGTSREAKATLAGLLKIRGLTAQLIPAAQVATRIAHLNGNPAVIAHIEDSDCIVSLWDGAQSHDVPLATATLWDVDRALRTQAALALLREHEIDVADDPSLQQDLFRQIREKRREGLPFPWEVSIAGAPVELTRDLVMPFLLPWAENIGSVMESLAQHHEQAVGATCSLLLVCAESLPPGALDTLQDLLGRKVVSIQLDMWTRCEVLAGA